MKKISVIVPENGVLSSITDTLRLFNLINEQLKSEGKKPRFDVQLVGFKKEIFLDNGIVCVKADKLLNEAFDNDLIIVPAITGDVLKGTHLNRHYFPWLSTQYKRGAEIASYCVGAFIVAATGLLDGKRCSTHWMYANEFRAFYPEVKLMDEKIINEQNGILSSGGGTSYWNLLLYLLEKYTNRQMVLFATRYFLLDIERQSQTAFMMFRGQKEHGDELVKNVQTYIEEHYKDKFNIEEMSAAFAIVRRTLERRFRKATRNSIAEYIQRIKIEAAKKEIELGRKTIHEIMYEIGYSDMKAFRDLFQKLTGLTPLDYKKKYAVASR
jgi:transcriptional regulator GlxA family with amidase domain